MENETKNQAKLVSIVLGIISVFSIGLILHHPIHEQSGIGSQILEVPNFISQTKWVHGSLIVFIMLYSICFKWHSDVFKSSIYSRTATFILHSGNFAMIGAALISGFIYPNVALRFIDASSNQLFAFEAIQQLSMQTNQSLASFAAYCWMASIVLWCTGYLKSYERFKWLYIGCLGISVFTIFALSFSLINLNLSGMILVAFEFSVWCILVALTIYPTKTTQ